MLVRTAEERDKQHVDAFLAEHGATRVARLGELVDARQHPALLAEADAMIPEGHLEDRGLAGFTFLPSRLGRRRRAC
jgi:hypothetical protein